MLKSLRKVLFFRTLLVTIYEIFYSGPPLEEILGAPLGVARVLRLGGKCQTCVNLAPVKN